MLLSIICVGFLAAAAAPIVVRVARSWTGWVMASAPLALAIVVLLSGWELSQSLSWAPALGLELSLRLDGLAALFLLLITTIGALVSIYTGAYLRGHPQLGRFFAFLMLFMAAMTGLVLADNLICLYLFWELTTVSSWLLIGFEHDREESRRAAWQALMVTSAGGLAMLVGFVLLGETAGTYSIRAILTDPVPVRESGFFVPILALVFAGGATKSALVPVHVWLPNAMAAPTPVSAYLHSAAMVKAGIYLLARFSPLFAETTTWIWLVAGVGAVTSVVAAWLALFQTDAKRLLAYTTISALGMMAFALGVGGPNGARAAMVLVVAHALYKGALFMVAGGIDHGAGTRDLREVSGLWGALPFTAFAATLAMASMVGLPPTLGYLADDGIVEVAQSSPKVAGELWIVLTVVGGTLYTGAGFVVGLRPFLGKRRSPREPHESSPGLWLGPLILGLTGVGLSIVPGALEQHIVEPAVAAIAGTTPSEPLKLWSGVTEPFLLGVAMLIGGGLICTAWSVVRSTLERLAWLGRMGPDQVYTLAERGLRRAALWLDRYVQHGYLPTYLFVVAATLVAVTLPSLAGVESLWPQVATSPNWTELGLAVLVILAAGGAIIARSRALVIACMSVVGYSVALLFAVFGGPDLAMTQVLVETLLTVLIVLLIPMLPRFEELSGTGTRWRDGIVCVAVGGVVAASLLGATALPPRARVANYYIENGPELAHGANIVNTILVDFRVGDTLGEIAVLSSAAVGAAGMIARGRRSRERSGGSDRRVARPALESVILTVAAKFLLPLLIVFAVFLLFSGHRAPGGGFSAALVLAASLALFLFGAPGPTERELLFLHPRALIAAGLAIAIGAGVPPLVRGEAFFEAEWLPWSLPVLGGFHLGTPVLFDMGVALVAAGALFLIFRSTEEHGPWRS